MENQRETDTEFSHDIELFEQIYKSSKADIDVSQLQDEKSEYISTVQNNKGKGQVALKNITGGTTLAHYVPLTIFHHSPTHTHRLYLLTAWAQHIMDFMNTTDTSTREKLQQIFHSLAPRTDETRSEEDREFSDLIKKLSTNCAGDGRSKSLYTTMSYFNHSCLPNVVRVHNPDLSVDMVAMDNIEEGEELTIDYYSVPIDDKATRSQFMNQVARFDCRCICCQPDSNRFPSELYLRHGARPHICTHCGLTPTRKLWCGACKSAVYCNEKCQTENWKLCHKELCNKYRGRWKHTSYVAPTPVAGLDAFNKKRTQENVK